MGKAEKPEKTNKKQKHFWKDFKAELKKVIWPTRSQVVNNTIIVLAIVIIVTAIVFVLDLAFETLNTYGIDKLKEFVQGTTTSQETNTDNNNSSSDNTNTEKGGENNGEGNTAPENNNENNGTPDDTKELDHVSE